LNREGVDLKYFVLEENRISPLSLIVVDQLSGKKAIIYTKGNAAI